MTVKISGNSSSSTPSFAGDDGDSGLHATADQVQLVTNGTVAMTVDSSQQVGIGTTTPLVASGFTGVTTSGSTGGILWFAKAGAQKGYIYGQDNDVTLASTDASGVIRFLSGGNTERLRILSSGGLTFNGDTAAANALDDYEEGNWTPTMFGGTTAGTTTYTHQTGHYTKIGNRVIVSGTVAATTSGASGDLRIGNFPFAASDESVGTFQANQLASWQSGVEQYSLIIQHTNSFCTFRGTKQAASFVTLQIQNVTYLRFDVSYQTNS